MHSLIKYVLALAVGLWVTSVSSQTLMEERQYEPYVARYWNDASRLFHGVDVDEVYLFAYDAATDNWRMMPFQIDEGSLVTDPDNPDIPPRWTYFADHNGILDSLDQLVFMIRDMGDEADTDEWIENEDSQNYPRLRIRLRDPENASITGFAYLYRSSTIPDTVPKPYDMAFNRSGLRVDSKYYGLALHPVNNMVKDIEIKPPFGSGVDILDRQKIRFNGVIGFNIVTIQGSLTEDDLVLFNHFKYTDDPVVRVIVEMKMTIIDTASLGDIFMFNDPKFYPFSGEVGGGFPLSTEELQLREGIIDDIFIEVHALRESWDLNSNAVGMTFQNPMNQTMPVDGAADVVNTDVDVPIREWTAASGNQGTVLFYLAMEDSTWQSTELYYHDNASGGTADQAHFPISDTGDDLQSFGDQGILLVNDPTEVADLTLHFKTFFLPSDFNRQDMIILADQQQLRPVGSTTSENKTSVEKEHGNRIPDEFILHPNYPNPFNSGTWISFTIRQDADIHLYIVDVQGRTIRTLIRDHHSSGRHQVRWNGKNDSMIPVPTGIYFTKLVANDRSQIQKLVYVK